MSIPRQSRVKYALDEVMALLDKAAACQFIGGSKPISPATLFRLIKAGRIPRPVKIGGSNRWVDTELEAAIERMIAEERTVRTRVRTAPTGARDPSAVI